MTNAELIKALRWCGSDDEQHEMCVDESYSCPMWNEDRMTDYCKADLMNDAADAIERLQSDLAKKDSQLTEWKNAWRIANSLYKSAQAEIDEHQAYQHGLIERIESLKAEQNGEEKHE